MSEQQPEKKSEGILSGVGDTVGNTFSGLTNTIGGAVGGVGKGLGDGVGAVGKGLGDTVSGATDGLSKTTKAVGNSAQGGVNYVTGSTGQKQTAENPLGMDK
eukprot:c37872_g1_i1 orf=43-348(+)